MSEATFKLYHKTPLPQAPQDQRNVTPGEYIGHVVVVHVCPKCKHRDDATTYGILAHTVTVGKGKTKRRHFEGRVMDWQQLIREHVANPTTNDQQADWVTRATGAANVPFDDSLEKV